MKISLENLQAGNVVVLRDGTQHVIESVIFTAPIQLLIAEAQEKYLTVYLKFAEDPFDEANIYGLYGNFSITEDPRDIVEIRDCVKAETESKVISNRTFLSFSIGNSSESYDAYDLIGQKIFDAVEHFKHDEKVNWFNEENYQFGHGLSIVSDKETIREIVNTMISESSKFVDYVENYIRESDSIEDEDDKEDFLYEKWKEMENSFLSTFSYNAVAEIKEDIDASRKYLEGLKELL